MNIVNLTPHNVSIKKNDGSFTVIASSGIARVSQKSEKISEIDGISVFKSTFGNIQGLPDPLVDTFFIVSALVKQLCGRNDVLSPAKLIRNEVGEVVGCEGLEA